MKVFLFFWVSMATPFFFTHSQGLPDKTCSMVIEHLIIQSAKEKKVEIEDVLRVISDNAPELTAFDAYRSATFFIDDNAAFFSALDNDFKGEILTLLKREGTDLFELSESVKEKVFSRLKSKYPKLDPLLLESITTNRFSSLYKAMKALILRVERQKISHTLTIKSKFLFTTVTTWKFFNQKIGYWLKSTYSDVGWEMDDLKNSKILRIRLEGPADQLENIINGIYSDELTKSIMGSSVEKYRSDNLKNVFDKVDRSELEVIRKPFLGFSAH